MFGVHSPELGQVFLVPVDDAPRRACSLRLEAAANGQQKRLRWARDYLLTSKKLPSLTPTPFAADEN